MKTILSAQRKIILGICLNRIGVGGPCFELILDQELKLLGITKLYYDDVQSYRDHDYIIDGPTRFFAVYHPRIFFFQDIGIILLANFTYSSSFREFCRFFFECHDSKEHHCEILCDICWILDLVDKAKPSRPFNSYAPEVIENTQFNYDRIHLINELMRAFLNTRINDLSDYEKQKIGHLMYSVRYSYTERVFCPNCNLKMLSRQTDSGSSHACTCGSLWKSKYRAELNRFLFNPQKKYTYIQLTRQN